MANKILIEYNISSALAKKEVTGKGKNKTETVSLSGVSNVKIAREVPLIAEPSIELNSDFTSFSEMIPSSISNIIGLMGKITSATGSVSSGFLDLTNKLDVPVWSRTEPARITVTLGFYLKKDAFEDVVKPTQEICQMAILSRDPVYKDRFIAPGLNLPSLREVSVNNKDQSVERSAKLVTIEIPGIIYLSRAIVKRAVPTFSKDLAESGYPIWATVDCEFVGLSSATTDIFLDVLNSSGTKANQEKFKMAKLKSKMLG